MNLAGLVVLFGVYTIVVLAIAALIFSIARRRRRPTPVDAGLAIPNVDGLRVKRPTLDVVAPNTAMLVMAGSRATAADAPADSPPASVPSGSATLQTTTWGAWSGEPPDGSGDGARLTESAPPGPVRSIAAVKPAPRPMLRAVPASPPQAATIVTTTAAPAVRESAVQAAAVQSPAPEPAALATAPPEDGDFPLAGIFTADDALLPEGLRTLDVAPNRTIEPGKTVRAAFTLRNPGGSPATGFRARFRLPAGLRYAGGSAQIDGTPIPDRDGQTALLMPSGAEIGAIPAGGECRVSLEYVVGEPLENGTTIALQAAVASPDVPVIGSNVARLVVRSRPNLQNARTGLSTASSGELHPGDELDLTATIHNSGQSSAHDLIILLPVPAHTSFVPNSLVVDGTPLADPASGGQFRFARPAVAAPLLAPGDTTTVGYRLRLDSPLEDATRIVAAGTVAAQEVAEFALTPLTFHATSTASFAADAAVLRVDTGDDVEPGGRVPLALRAHNVGTATARNVAVHFTLPDGLAYVPGSLTIDGAFAPDRPAASAVLALGDLGPGRAIDVAIVAIVQSPLADGTRLAPGVRLTWSTGERSFARELTVRSAPRFPLEFNRIDRETPLRVGPSATVTYTVALANLGTDIAAEPRLHLTADEALRNLRVRDGETELRVGLDGSVALAPLVPGVARRIRIDGRIAGVVEDQKSVGLHALLVPAPGVRIDLGDAVHVIESLPRFSAASSRITSESGDARLKQLGTFRLTLTNEGTDSAHDVRVAIDVPAELRIDGVEHALLEGNAVVFGEIPAGGQRTAQIRVRLVGVVSGGDPISIAARVSGANVVPLNLVPIELETSGEAAFAEGASLTCAPWSDVRAGADLFYTLRLRNSGDGPAKHLTARIAQLTNAVYAQGSTNVNGVALADHNGSSLLHSDAGLHLADVGVGIDVVVAWRVIVNMPLPPNSTVACAVSVSWDDAPAITVEARPVDVISLAALPVINPELPFTVLGATEANR